MSESILIVEDDKALRYDIDEILSSAGYNVIHAENGKEAVDIVKNNLPDLVVSDIMMPVIDGYELLEHFQKETQLENIPFIFLTAKSTKSDIRKGMNEGADDYIIKPFRAKDLLTAVQIRLNKKNKWQKKIAKIRESFALTVPHELRTPLIPVLGFADIILDDFNNLSKDEIYDMVKRIKSGATRLHSRIERFILFSSVRGDLSDAEAVKFLRKETIISFEELISSTINEAAKNYNRFSDIKIDLQPSDKGLRISDYYFPIIINELTDNSCKYSEPETVIMIKGTKQNDLYEITFSNNGRGLNQEQINNINLFEQFPVIDQAKSGSGIGLYLVREILKAFKGHFNIESEPGKFTKVSIQIPLEESNSKI
ncbi:MAG: ATP-binding response regulator [Ignavibacteriaceae bacterium]